MGARTAVTAEQYLETSFPDVDREYRDGELVERALPNYLHGRTQGFFFAFFAALESELSVHPCVETRMELRKGLYLIPDVAVFHPREPQRRVPDTPPLVAVEILSPDDRMSEVLGKLQDYCNWGVPHVWLADPHAKRLYRFDSALVPVPSLRIPELNVEVKPDDVFR